MAAGGVTSCSSSPMRKSPRLRQRQLPWAMPSRPVSSDELAEAQLCQRRNEWHGGDTRGLGISQSTGARRPVLQCGSLGPALALPCGGRGASMSASALCPLPSPPGPVEPIRDMTSCRQTLERTRTAISRGTARLAVRRACGISAGGRSHSPEASSSERATSELAVGERGKEAVAWVPKPSQQRPGGAPQMRYCDTTRPASSGARLAPESGACSAGLPKPATTQGASPAEDRLASASQAHRHSRSVIRPVHFLQTLAITYSTYRFLQCLAAPPGPQQRPRSAGACLALQGSCLSRVSTRDTLMRAGADQPEERRDG